MQKIIHLSVMSCGVNRFDMIYIIVLNDNHNNSSNSKSSNNNNNSEIYDNNNINNKNLFKPLQLVNAADYNWLV